MASAHSGVTTALIQAESITVPRNEICWLGDSALLEKLTLSPRHSNGAFPLHGAARYGSVWFTLGGFSTGYCTWYLVIF